MTKGLFSEDGAQLAIKVTQPKEIIHHQIEDWQLDVLTSNHDDTSREFALGAGFAAVGAAPGALSCIGEVHRGGFAALTTSNVVSFIIFVACLVLVIGMLAVRRNLPNKPISMRDEIRARTSSENTDK